MAGQQPDHDAGLLLGTAPPPTSGNALDIVVDILDQSASDCVANSIQQAVRGAQVKAGVDSPELGSRRFGYWVSRAYHHDQGVDEGTYLRTYFQALNRFGFCREKIYPYESSLTDMPSAAAFRAALDQSSPTVYKRISSAGRARVDDVKRAIAAGYLVSFGTLVSSDFCSNKLGKGPLPPPIGQEIAGGHALVIGAYQDDAFTIINSWSESWGHGGLCEFAAAYLEWPETNDLWIVEQAPEYSE
jgi:hypothetical protein